MVNGNKQVLTESSDSQFLLQVAGQTEAVVTRWGWCVPTGENYVLQPPSLFDKKDPTRSAAQLIAVELTQLGGPRIRGRGDLSLIHQSLKNHIPNPLVLVW